MRGVIFFGAHADDIELGAGGTCAKLCAAGVEVHVVIATDESQPEVSAARRREAIAGAAMLGVPGSRVHFLGFPDGGVRCERGTVAKVRALLMEKKIRPDLVFTHTEFDSHQDHVELTRIVRGAVRGAALVKYIVRNSGVVSHFTPSIYSAVDDFIAAKTRSLCEHRSQVVAGRVDIDVLSAFAKRYSFNMDNRNFEAFELEVQEGAVGFLDLLDRINDAPFNRLWHPICSRSALTVIAPGERRAGRERVVCDAPGDLQLVTRLQAELSRLAQGLAVNGSADSLVVASANSSKLKDLPAGTTLLLGGPGVNSFARPLFELSRELRFQVDIAVDRKGYYPIIDTRSGRAFEPKYVARGGVSELSSDYGLLTIVRSCVAGIDRLVICAMGNHQAGLAAAFSCLTRMDHVAFVAENARAVIDGRAKAAQWLIPCDASGNPKLDKIKSDLVRTGPRARTRRSARARRPAQALAAAE